MLGLRLYVFFSVHLVSESVEDVGCFDVVPAAHIGSSVSRVHRNDYFQTNKVSNGSIIV